MARPRKEITDEHLHQIEQLAGYGLTEAMIARAIGLAPRTFRQKKHEKRVSAALEKGRAQAQQKVGQALFQKAMDGDLGAIVWWEKTRAGRTDKVQHEHAGPGGAPIPHDVRVTLVKPEQHAD